jgi:hypothetical protein
MLGSYRPRGRPKKDEDFSLPEPSAEGGDDGPVNPPNMPIMWAPTSSFGASTDFEHAVLGMIESMRPDNTTNAYDGKVNEFLEYCVALFPEGPYRYTIDSTKIYKFMFYQAMRPQRKRGGKGGTRQQFSLTDYNEVMDVYKTWLVNPTTAPAEPQMPIGVSAFVQYQQAIKWVHARHVAERMTGYTWEHVWTLPLRNLHQLVKNRRNRVSKKNFVEKVNHEFSPYQAVEEYDKIENELWSRGQTCARSAYAWIRHRFCLLYSTSGILRCESLFGGELSDYMGLEFKKPQDPHPLELLVTQIPSGKTNHGTHLYGRALRHKLVELCAVGAFTIYLAFRFHLTREFDLFTLEDWLDNKKWFNVKLLVDASRGDTNLEQEMDNGSYARSIKKVLKALMIPSSHFVHLGRTLGPKILELLEEESEAIRQLGNWDPKIQETSYSTKLPLGPMRKIGGWVSGNGMFYCPRTRPLPSIPLQKSTPYGFSFEQYDLVDQAVADGETCFTALSFLKLMKNSAKIFLQDAAAMLILHPERESHPIYSLECFHHDDWKVSFRLSLMQIYFLSANIFLFYFSPF